MRINRKPEGIYVKIMIILNSSGLFIVDEYTRVLARSSKTVRSDRSVFPRSSYRSYVDNRLRLRCNL